MSNATRLAVLVIGALTILALTQNMVSFPLVPDLQLDSIHFNNTCYTVGNTYASHEIISAAYQAYINPPIIFQLYIDVKIDPSCSIRWNITDISLVQITPNDTATFHISYTDGASVPVYSVLQHDAGVNMTTDNYKAYLDRYVDIIIFTTRDQTTFGQTTDFDILFLFMLLFFDIFAILLAISIVGIIEKKKIHQDNIFNTVGTCAILTLMATLLLSLWNISFRSLCFLAEVFFLCSLISSLIISWQKEDHS